MFTYTHLNIMLKIHVEITMSEHMFSLNELVFEILVDLAVKYRANIYITAE